LRPARNPACSSVSWPQRHLRRHYLQHIVHDVQYVDRFGGQHSCQAVVGGLLQFAPARIVARFGRSRVDALAQLHDERVVALEVALDVGQFLRLREQALREHLLARQQALAHALGEGLVLDRRDALEEPRLLELGLRVQLQQRVGRNATIVTERQLAGADALLQHAARYADQLRGAPHCHRVRHVASSSGVAGGLTRSR
jgi:hypothetical protein